MVFAGACLLVILMISRVVLNYYGWFVSFGELLGCLKFHCAEGDAVLGV